MPPPPSPFCTRTHLRPLASRGNGPPPLFCRPQPPRRRQSSCGPCYRVTCTCTDPRHEQSQTVECRGSSPRQDISRDTHFSSTPPHLTNTRNCTISSSAQQQQLQGTTAELPAPTPPEPSSSTTELPCRPSHISDHNRCRPAHTPHSHGSHRGTSVAWRVPHARHAHGFSTAKNPMSLLWTTGRPAPPPPPPPPPGLHGTTRTKGTGLCWEINIRVVPQPGMLIVRV
jgi:hypothetical protein